MYAAKMLVLTTAFERSTWRRTGDGPPTHHHYQASQASHARHAKSFTQEPLDPDKSERIYALAILLALSRAMDEMTQMLSQHSAVTVSRETASPLFRCEQARQLFINLLPLRYRILRPRSVT